LSEGLRELAEKLRGYGVRLIILFGSRARGDYTEDSDVDVLVVADQLPRDPREAYAVVAKLAGPKVTPTCLNTESFMKRLEDESTMIMEVLEDGKVVYADEGFLEEVRAKYREVRGRWTRSGKTWKRVAKQF
jgi:predicted nucleotidyltransferase